jgi:hypothetical protein
MTTIDQIAGMTVNERLAHFDLFRAFDSAVAARDLSAVVSVLRQARVTDQQAHQTAAEILANPTHYGLR